MKRPNVQRLLSGLFLLLITTTLTSATAQGAVIYDFQGSPYDLFFTNAGGIPFTGADRISGTVTFDSIGAPEARGFSLSTTVGGVPGFTIDVADVSSPGAAVISLNTFTWAGGLPQFFVLTVESEMFGTLDGPEQLSISDIGDLATIDFSSLKESNGLNSTAGTFTLIQSAAVPEPGSLALGTCLSVAFGLGYLRTRRRKQSTPN